MKRISKEELRLMEIVLPTFKNKKLLGDGGTCYRTGKNSYIVDEEEYENYSRRIHYSFKIYDSKMNRIDGFGNKLYGKRLREINKIVEEGIANRNKK